jgi:glucose/arabinose dehydrogenase
VWLAAALVALGFAACGAGDERARSRSELVPIGAGLRGPAGLAATVYATGLPNASAFAVDGRGRLWVATSAASDHRNDGVYLVDRAGPRPVNVVAGVRGPLGLTWYRGRLYVASLGRVDAFGGLHGTRFSKRSTILVEPKGHGWNNGIVAAPNGRLVMGISSACDHCTPTSRWSATIVNFRPDGSDVRVFAKGIRAPFGLAFHPGTSDLLVTMNQRDDLGARTPGDWLARVSAGDDWRFPACHGQGGAACAGVPGPIAVLDKHAAAGAVAIVDGRLAGSAASAALVAEWQTGRVLRVALARSGTASRGAATPFLTGVRNPLALATTRDGALLVGDWGIGRVYRIARRGRPAGQSRAGRSRPMSATASRSSWSRCWHMIRCTPSSRRAPICSAASSSVPTIQPGGGLGRNDAASPPIRPARRSARPRSSARSRPTSTPVMTENASGSRPASSQARATAARLWRTSATVGKTVLYSSA